MALWCTLTGIELYPLGYPCPLGISRRACAPRWTFSVFPQKTYVNQCVACACPPPKCPFTSTRGVWSQWATSTTPSSPRWRTEASSARTSAPLSRLSARSTVLVASVLRRLATTAPATAGASSAATDHHQDGRLNLRIQAKKQGVRSIPVRPTLFIIKQIMASVGRFLFLLCIYVY